MLISSQIKKLSNEEIIIAIETLFEKLKAQTLQLIKEIAPLWKEANNRGIDMSAYSAGIWKYVPLVASGSLKAEFIHAYGTRPRLIQGIMGLVPEDQEKLLKDDKVAVLTDDGEKQVCISSLSLKQIDQVFSNRILHPSEQKVDRPRPVKSNRPIQVSLGSINVLPRERDALLKNLKGKVLGKVLYDLLKKEGLFNP